MPEPLKRIKKDGTAYERPPEIEDWLKKLETVEAAERLRQFATLSRKGVGYVPSDHFDCALDLDASFQRRDWAA